MASAADFAKFVPGFDFLQGLLRGAGQVLPDMGKWVAPTLDPEELGQRIEQLKTVQMWLEQNARMLGATVQALEVQRMTLATLKSMNVPVADLGQALKARAFTGEPAPADPAPAAGAAAAAGAAKEGARRTGRKSTTKARAAAAQASGAAQAARAAPAVDPMQWWGALTQQFTQLAAQAVKEGPVEAARSAASQFADAAARAAVKADVTPGHTPGRARRPRRGATVRSP
jgi:hypothetical protein